MLPAGRDASCASEGRVRGHPRGGLAVARSERAGMPASDERTATVAPLMSPPPPRRPSVPFPGGKQGGWVWEGGAARGAKAARSD